MDGRKDAKYKQDKAALCRAFSKIIENVSNVNLVLDFLVQYFNSDEIQQIRAKSTANDQVRQLLFTVSARPYLIRKVFILALQNAGYTEAANALNEELANDVNSNENQTPYYTENNEELNDYVDENRDANLNKKQTSDYSENNEEPKGEFEGENGKVDIS